MLFSLFSPRPLTEEQKRQIHRRCRSVLNAYNVCRRANADDAAPCLYLETSAISCVAEICCRPTLQNYERCVRDSTDNVSLDKCSSHLNKMKRCLERYGQYPFVS